MTFGSPIKVVFSLSLSRAHAAMHATYIFAGNHVRKLGFSMVIRSPFEYQLTSLHLPIYIYMNSLLTMHAYLLTLNPTLEEMITECRLQLVSFSVIYYYS